MATTGYQAAPESNDVQLSYVLEPSWGATASTGAFQAIRFTGESLASKKTRQRPAEVKTDGQVSAAVTTQVSAGGQVNFAWSYGTYDDFVAALLGSTWSADLGIAMNSTAPDMSIVASTASGSPSLITSATTGKFDGVSLGQWIKLAGSSLAANYGFFKVSSTAVAGSTAPSIGVASTTLVAQAGSSGFQLTIGGSMLRNGTVFQTVGIMKQLVSGSEYLYYPGSYPTAGTITAEQGKFVEGSFTFLSKNEYSSTATLSSTGVTSANTYDVVDTVGGFQQLTLDTAAISAVCKGIDVTITRQGAAGEYGVGSAASQGQIRGLLEITGKGNFYFSSFALYNLYTAEMKHAISYLSHSDTNRSYMFTFPAATLMNPQIVAGGPNQPVMANFDIEGNPDSVYNISFQIDRFSSTS